jgi:hypothetical protein
MIPLSDNRGAGAALGNWMESKRLTDKDSFIVDVIQ